MASSKPKSNASFQQRLADLNAIVAWFETEDMDIDEALKQYEKGLELIKELNDYLKTAKNKVEAIKLKF